jgi:hypothetical protein
LVLIRSVKEVPHWVSGLSPWSSFPWYAGVPRLQRNPRSREPVAHIITQLPVPTVILGMNSVRPRRTSCLRASNVGGRPNGRMSRKPRRSWRSISPWVPTDYGPTPPPNSEDTRRSAQSRDSAPLQISPAQITRVQIRRAADYAHIDYARHRFYPSITRAPVTLEGS